MKQGHVGATPSGQCWANRGANRLILSQGEPVHWMLECSQESHKICEISLGHQYVYIINYIYSSVLPPNLPLKNNTLCVGYLIQKRKRIWCVNKLFLDRNLKTNKKTNKNTIQQSHKKKKSTTFRKMPFIQKIPTKKQAQLSGNKFHSSQKNPKKRFVFFKHGKSRKWSACSRWCAGLLVTPRLFPTP